MSFTAKDLSIGDNCFPCRPGVAAPNMKGGYPPEGLGDASPPYLPPGLQPRHEPKSPLPRRVQAPPAPVGGPGAAI